MVEPHIQSFLEALSTREELWRSVDIRVVACRAWGAWHNLAARIVFSARDPRDIPVTVTPPVAANIGCWQRVGSAADGRAALESLLGGELEIEGSKIHFLQQESNAQPAPLRYSIGGVSTGDLRSRGELGAEFRSGFSVMLVGGGQQTIFSQVPGGRDGLDNELRLLPNLWDGLESLTRVFLRSADRIEYSRLCHVDVVALLEAALEPAECELRQGALSFGIRLAAPHLATQCSLGVFGFDAAGAVVSQSLSLADAEPSIGANGSHISGTFEVPGLSAGALLLRAWGAVADRQQVVDASSSGTNRRIAAHEAFDEDLRIIQDNLSPAPGSSARLFEHAVARLFVLSGFIVDGFASEKQYEEGVDALAFAPGGIVLAIECTTSTPDADKVGKLRARRARVADAVGDGDVIAVVVSAVSRSEHTHVASHPEPPIGVAFLYREDLEAILAGARRNSPPEETLAMIYRYRESDEPAAAKLFPFGTLRRGTQ